MTRSARDYLNNNILIREQDGTDSVLIFLFLENRLSILCRETPCLYDVDSQIVVKLPCCCVYLSYYKDKM